MNRKNLGLAYVAANAKHSLTLALLLSASVGCGRTTIAPAPTPAPPPSTSPAAPPSAPSAPAVGFEPAVEAATAPTPSSDPPAPESPAAAPIPPCEQALHDARKELLDRGFSPTKETERWLHVSEDPDTQQLALSLYMRKSADGPATWYALAIDVRAPRASAWQKSVQSLCCDDHAAEEDHIKELSWRRQRGTKLAHVSVAYFGDVKDKEYLAERELFVSVAKKAGDQCLDASSAKSEDN